MPIVTDLIPEFFQAVNAHGRPGYNSDSVIRQGIEELRGFLPYMLCDLLSHRSKTSVSVCLGQINIGLVAWTELIKVKCQHIYV